LLPESIELHPDPPPWVRGDIRSDVIHRAGWDQPLSMLDEELPQRIADAFEFHPWVERAKVTLKYPAQARRMGIEGKVYVTFVVGKEGEITDVKVLKGIGAGCDEEAIRVLSGAPNWKPGKQRGRPVRVRMQLPIIFKLN